jgi:hypothetical protein
MQRFLTASSTLLLALVAVASTPAAGGHPTTPRSFRAARHSGTIDLVQAALEVGGELKIVDQGKVERTKMSVAAHFVYEEKPLGGSGSAGGPMRSIRYYQQASGTIQSGDYQYQPKLRDERRLIAVHVDQPEVTLFSLQGPLTFDELELIDVLANSLVLDRLLPAGEPVASGAEWQHADALVAVLLGLDRIDKNEVTSTFTGVSEGKARFEMSGRVDGQEEGVSTKIELKGKYHFDLQVKRITWLGILVREDRAAGHADTGFEAVARLQMRITPGKRSDHLTAEQLAGADWEPTPEQMHLSYEPPGGKWRLAHDRRWSVITEEEDRAVLRLIDEGDKLAQCNVALLPHSPDATQLPLERFQADVISALGENFQKVIRSSQRHNENDYRVFQVVAEGEASEVAMHWIYYLLTDKHGRRVVLAFVLEKAMLDRFDQAAERLVGGLRLAEPKIASKPAGKEPSDGSQENKAAAFPKSGRGGRGSNLPRLRPDASLRDERGPGVLSHQPWMAPAHAKGLAPPSEWRREA